MTAQEQRLLDCHAAWIHGALSLKELYQEVWRACPEPTNEEKALLKAGITLAYAARCMIERQAIEILNYRTDLG